MATMRRRVGTYGTGMATGARSGMLLLARLVRLITMIVVGIIVLGILLVLLKANMGNQIVSTIHDWAKTLAGPFDDLFKISGRKGVAVNWGVAAIVYAIVGSFIARLLTR
ncbi:MAG: hypothetical protein ACXVFN_10045 [Solirubrobacteraceae bacterium]